MDPIYMATKPAKEGEMKYHFYANSSGLFQFKVRVAHDAYVALSTVTSETTPYYEILIGADNNTNSHFRKNGGEYLVSVETPDILSKYEFRGFWIRWNKFNITAGRQGETTPFIDYTDDEKVPVKFAGAANGWGAAGPWVIEQSTSTADYQGPRYPIQLSLRDQFTIRFFRNSSGAFQFKVRAPNAANVVLATTAAETHPMYEVVLGGEDNTISLLRKNGEELVRVETPDILDYNDLRGFWIRWNNLKITAGKKGESTQFIQYTDSERVQVNFVGVSSDCGTPNPWVIEKSLEPTWIACEDGRVPCKAVIGGEENGEDMFVIRAYQGNSWIPGKLISNRRASLVGSEGKESSHPQYEVLCNFNGTWKECKGKAIPDNAVVAGQTTDGENLFVGRAMHRGSLTVGKVQASTGVCYVPSDGKEVAYDEYEVLANLA